MKFSKKKVSVALILLVAILISGLITLVHLYKEYNWISYSDSDVPISFKYPPDWTMQRDTTPDGPLWLLKPNTNPTQDSWLYNVRISYLEEGWSRPASEEYDSTNYTLISDIKGAKLFVSKKDSRSYLLDIGHAFISADVYDPSVPDPNYPPLPEPKSFENVKISKEIAATLKMTAPDKVWPAEQQD